MTLRLRRFEVGDAGAIERLNERLRAGGATAVVYPEGAEQDPSRPVRERLFVAADDAEIRGGVWLREQSFRVGGADAIFGWLKYPVAESLVDTRFSGVPASLLLTCLREQPRLITLGLGGHGPPLPRMLRRLGWTGETVPFLFRVVRAGPFLRELVPLRRGPARRAAADALAWSGLGWLGLKLLNASRGVIGRKPGGWTIEVCDVFADWADSVWARCRDAYSFLTVRDHAALNDMYRSAPPDVHRLRVHRGGDVIGWAVVVRHDFSVGEPDPNFGRMTVGFFADALAVPADALTVASAAYAFLRDSGVDVVITNQLHPAWIKALRALGFLAGPSTFAFYRAPAAEAMLAAAARSGSPHVNRGDCDGPMWYRPR